MRLRTLTNTYVECQLEHEKQQELKVAREKEADKLRREQAAKDARARKLEISARKKREQREIKAEQQRKAAERKAQQQVAYNAQRREQYRLAPTGTTKKEKELFEEIAKLKDAVNQRKQEDDLAEAKKLAIVE